MTGIAGNLLRAVDGMRELEIVKTLASGKSLARVSLHEIRLVGVRVSMLARAVAGEADSDGRHGVVRAPFEVEVTGIAADTLIAVLAMTERARLDAHREQTAAGSKQQDDRGGKRQGDGGGTSRRSHSHQNHNLRPMVTVWYSVTESLSYW